MNQPIRQGDIVLVPVEDRGRAANIRMTGTTEKRVRGKGLIVAAGEATGHHHRVETKGVKIIVKDGVRYLQVPKGKTAEFVHEEHETLSVPAGLHEIRRHREHVAPVSPKAAPRQSYVRD